MMRWGAWVLATAAAGAVLFVGAYVIDTTLHGDRVARNVTIDGVHVGSLDPAALDRYLAGVRDTVAQRPILLDGGDRAIEARLSDVGIVLDSMRVRTDALAAGGDGSFWSDVISWWSSFGTPRQVELTFVADPAIARAYIAARPEQRPYEPVEPAYSGSTGEWIVHAGSSGLALDPADAADAVAAIAGRGYPPSVVAVAWQPVPPRIDEAELEASLSAAEAMAIDLDIYVNGWSGTIGRGTVRRWIDSELTADGLVPRFDLERAEASVQRLFSGFIDPGTPPVFTVVDGVVDAELGREPLRCCAPGFGAELEEAALTGNLTVVQLPPTPVYEDAGLAAVEAMGID